MLGLDSYQYWNSAYQVLKYNDVITGLVKPLVFGFIIATVGCYYGMNTKGGTQGVGRSTTQAVVVVLRAHPGRGRRPDSTLHYPEMS